MNSDPRLIAFYLPQFHPIPENDAWWGKGFTEWTTASKATPLFRGHYQPHLPADLGFYDLRLPGAREAQAQLARDYGIFGFCYYHYWFEGRRVLEHPFQEVLSSGTPDFPFCLCWANESWTRTWDGGDKHVLIEQVYSEADDLNHIRWLASAFRDRRYIRVDDKPLFLVYRAGKLPDALRTTTLWRTEAARLGIGDIFLVKVESFDDRSDPGPLGFDASLEFQPDGLRLGRRVNDAASWREAREYTAAEAGHSVYDYADVVTRMLDQTPVPFKRFPCVTPSWDNSARRKKDAAILDNSTPALYEYWLRQVVSRARKAQGDSVVFVNAWNEWGEGNHLEPCQRWGRAYLDATRRALDDATVAEVPRQRPSGTATSRLKYTQRLDDPDQSHSIVLRLVEGAHRVLEIGAATGYLTEAIIRQGSEVVAVESDPDAVAIAQGRGIHVRLGTLAQTIGASDQFDCTVLADVIEHIAEPDELLDEVIRHLSPLGSIVLSVRNSAHLSARYPRLAGRFDNASAGLLNEAAATSYTAASLEQLLERHGLQTVERQHAIGPYVLKRMKSWRVDWYRRRVLRSLVSQYPSLFAYQFVWKATRAP